MGLFDKLLPSRQAVGLLVADPKNLQIASPWSGSNLTRVVLADVAGIKLDEINRADAMRIPAVVKARGLIVGHLARLPLKLWDTETETEQATPTWLTSTKTLQSPRMRLAWTLDDLIFTGMSLWAVERDENDAITDAVRVPRTQWSVDQDSLGVIVNGETVTDTRSVILFEGLQEGVCVIGAHELQGMLDMSNAWRQRVESPIPNVAIVQTEANTQLTEDEEDDTVLDWEAARRQGGTAMVPFGYDVKEMGTAQTDLFISGRNASRLDVANFLQVPADMLEGSMATASLTYSTTQGRRSDFIESCLKYWAEPVEARLSQDDVTPDGTAVRFDWSDLTAVDMPATTISSED